MTKKGTRTARTVGERLAEFAELTALGIAGVGIPVALLALSKARRAAAYAELAPVPATVTQRPAVLPQPATAAPFDPSSPAPIVDAEWATIDDAYRAPSPTDTKAKRRAKKAR